MAYEWGFTTSPEEEVSEGVSSDARRWAQAVQEFYDRQRAVDLASRPDEPIDLVVNDDYV